MYYKDVKQEKKKTDSNKPRVERVSVWELKSVKCPESTLDTEWPVYNNERDRIKYNSIKYKDVSISEAMCGIKMDVSEAPELPINPIIGSTHLVTLNKTKTGEVYVTGLSTKESVVCKNNLGKYKNLKLDNLKTFATITHYDKTRQTITVDVIKPIFDSWINEIMNDLTVQYDINKPQTVRVENLKLCPGGFIGKAMIPAVSDFVGEPYYVDAFIPGSQIVLNIEKDFNAWEGKTVDTFVAGYNEKNDGRPALICSRKDLLNFYGNLDKIELYKAYCENNDLWKQISEDVHSSVVTGVINSSKKCGVFVEWGNITGMINTEPEKLVEYKNGQEVIIAIDGFEQMVEYDNTMDTIKHLEPYTIENGKLKNCILKPIFLDVRH